jgi:hypothetical protein
LVSRRNIEGKTHGQEINHLDLLKFLISDLVLDLDKVLIVFVLIFRLGSLSLALTLGLTLGDRGLGLLGGGSDFFVVGGVVARRQDNGGRALSGRLGSRSLGCSALDDGIVLRVHLLPQSSPGVASRADGETGTLSEL